MKQAYINRIKSALSQLVLIGSVIFAMSWWQTRTMASGLADPMRLPAITGEQVLVPDPSGGRVNLVYFFAPWCGVCQMSMPNLNKIQQEFPEIRIQVVALDYASPQEVEDFINEHKIDLPVVYGSDAVRKAWRVSAYPSYFVVDGDLKIRARAVGYSSKFGMMVKILWVRLFA